MDVIDLDLSKMRVKKFVFSLNVFFTDLFVLVIV